MKEKTRNPNQCSVSHVWMAKDHLSFIRLQKKKNYCDFNYYLTSEARTIRHTHTDRKKRVLASDTLNRKHTHESDRN